MYLSANIIQGYQINHRGIYMFCILHRFILLTLLTLTFSLRTGWVYADDNIADVLIVGAGLSGLSSAYYLKKAGKCQRHYF